MRWHFQQTPLFERTVWINVGVTSLVGMFLFMFSSWKATELWAVVAGVMLACTPRLRAGPRAVAIVAAVFLPSVALIAPYSIIAPAIAGALLGGALAWIRMGEPLEGHRPLHFDVWQALAAAGAGALSLSLTAPILAAVVRTLQALGVPDLVGAVVGLGGAALVVSLTALPLHVLLRRDPIVAAGEALQQELRGRPLHASERLLSLYADCQRFLSELPREASRIELTRTLSELTQAALQQLRECSRVDQELRVRIIESKSDEGERLQNLYSSTTDEVARQHLQVAIEAIAEEEAQLQSLRTASQRACARVEALLATLQRTRGALSGIRHGHSEVKSAELSALARKLSSLSATQALEAEVMREVARGAELDQLSVT